MIDWFGWANATVGTIGAQEVRWSDLLGSAAGLATVALAGRRSVLTWPVQIVGSVLLFGASVSAHLGGNAARQVVLALLAAYGWQRWVSGRRRSRAVRVRWAGGRERIALVAGLVVGTLAFAELLSVTHASWAPLPDAYIFIGSVVATVAQARGWVEFWLVWVAVDVVGVPLAVEHGLVVSGLVYGVYFVLCVLGLRDWARQSRTPAGSGSSEGPEPGVGQPAARAAGRTESGR